MKIAFVGTHSAGKTTTINSVFGFLKSRGIDNVVLIPELARMCPYPINKVADFKTVWWIITSQINYERWFQSLYDVVLCDRSIFDALAYAEYMILSDKDMKFLRMVVTGYTIDYPYDKIFFFNPIELRDDGIRDLDKEFQKEIDENLRKILVDCEVPNVEFFGGSKESKFLKTFERVWNEING